MTQVEVSAKELYGNPRRITSEDLRYIEYRIVHNRYAETEVGAMSLDYSKVFEAGRTMITVVNFLISTISFSSLKIQFDHENACTEGWFTIDSYKSYRTSKIGRSRSMTSKDATLYFKYDGKSIEPYYTIRLYTKDSPDGSMVRYPIDPSMVLSYDMNFPAPSILTSQLLFILDQFI